MLIKSQMSPKNYWWEQPALKIKPKLIFPPNDSPRLVAQTLTISYNHWNLIHPFLTPPGRTGLRFLWASQNISRALSLLFQQVLSVMYDDIWLLIVTAFYPFYEKKLWGDFMSSVVFLPSNSITFFMLLVTLIWVQQMSPVILSSCNRSPGNLEFSIFVCVIYSGCHREFL